DEYDTVYLNHDEEEKDEFCIKDPSQILRWVIVIERDEDSKVEEYGMDTEFVNTQCGCI
ncbi:unnamed protein product, partial [Didymodactylos carnosus]